MPNTLTLDNLMPTLKKSVFLPGPLGTYCWERARGVPPVAKVMRLRGPTGKGESLKGASLDLLVHLPQNQSLPAVLHYAFRVRF